LEQGHAKEQETKENSENMKKIIDECGSEWYSRLAMERSFFYA
jgi:hypothetical protein